MKKIISMFVIVLCAISTNLKAQSNSTAVVNDKTVKHQCCMKDTAAKACNMQGKNMSMTPGKEKNCSKMDCAKMCKGKDSTCMNSKMTKGNKKSCDMNSDGSKKMKDCPMMKD